MAKDNKELLEVLEKIAVRLDWIANYLQAISSGESTIHIVKDEEV